MHCYNKDRLHFAFNNVESNHLIQAPPPTFSKDREFLNIMRMTGRTKTMQKCKAKYVS